MTDLRRALKPAALCGWLCIGSLLAGGLLADDIDQEQVLRLVEQGRILPLQSLIDDALQRFPGRFLEAELEFDDGRYEYEIEVITRDGRVLELEYDAVTGTLLDIDIDEDD
ncbi:PepSY domain-containing protein [Halopseudomonas salegens]|uniref:Peptidase propeptide and YPEB domain-containing protein n=1 Tax=Halopseudomonas salegens TaxID=1434072 RepID=A0A1H2FMF3_9GAMM|nr:PepSY domain-containing protein [Halopseudomonas salegens]SDU08540.1 Peptidase propeptide and YPEB domain-containing protein [Halopseudomonas salegens]